MRRNGNLKLKLGEGVLDIFLGAGTVIVAAELLGRIAYGTGYGNNGGLRYYRDWHGWWRQVKTIKHNESKHA